MATTLKDLMDAANAVVARVSVNEAQDLIAKGAMLLDVRDAPEIEKLGLAQGAIHVSRGMLEFRADAGSPYHDKAFDKHRPVVIYCASGGRAALAGKALLDMGYEKVVNIGGFKDWAEAGGAVAHPLDPGMS